MPCAMSPVLEVQGRQRTRVTMVLISVPEMVKRSGSLPLSATELGRQCRKLPRVIGSQELLHPTDTGTLVRCECETPVGILTIESGVFKPFKRSRSTPPLGARLDCRSCATVEIMQGKSASRAAKTRFQSLVQQLGSCLPPQPNNLHRVAHSSSKIAAYSSSTTFLRTVNSRKSTHRAECTGDSDSQRRLSYAQAVGEGETFETRARS